MKKILSFLIALFAITALGDVTLPTGTKSVQSNEAFNRFNLYIIRSIYLADGGTHTMRISAPAFLANDSYAFIFPGSDGTSGEVLTTDGSGNLSWGPSFPVGGITNADVSPTAGIVYTKLNLTNSIVNADVATSAAVAYSKLNLTGAVVNADVSNSAAVAYSKLNLTGGVVNADVSNSAAVAYSKLNLSNSVTNSDIATSAAVTYSKLNLTGGVVNSDVSNSAAIVYSKLNLTSGVVNSDVSNSAAIAYSKLNLTGGVINTDVSNSAAIAYSKLNLANSVINSDIATSAAVAYSKLNLTGDIVNSDVSNSAAIAYSKLNLTSSVVNADISNSAAIAYSKLNLSNSVTNSDIATSAAVSYSKLNLANSIVNNDIASGAAIDYAKLNLSNSISTGDLASGLLVPITKGGTGQTTKAAAFDALSPMTTTGDIIYGGVGGTGTRLPHASSSTNTLHSGTPPLWAAVTLSSDVDGTLPILNGGTGQTTKAAAFDALSPMSAAGDIIYGGTSGTGTRLAAGSSTQVLHSGTTPSYSAVSLTADVTGTLPIGNGGSGQVTANAALNAFLPSQTSNSGKVLGTNGTNTSWVSTFTNPLTTTGDMVYSSDNSGTATRLPIGTSTQLIHGGTIPTYAAVSLTADVSGILPTANGGTNQNSTATFPTSGVVVTEAGTETLTNKTLKDSTTSIVDNTDVTKLLRFDVTGGTGINTTIRSAQTTDAIFSMPNLTSDDTFTMLSATQSIDNKTFNNSNTAFFQDTKFTIQDASVSTKTIVFDAGGSSSTSTTLTTAPTTNRVLTFPDATDTLVGKATTDTLTNKTLTGNTAVNLVSGSGTLTLNTTGTITVPNATDTLIGKATTDTLTNKSISGSTNTITNVSLTTGVTGVLPLANGGTNKNMSVTQGGLVWTDSDSQEVSAAGTTSDWALSGGTGAPTFSSTTTTAKNITGSADAIQLKVTGNSTQTNDIVDVFKSDGTTNLLAVTNTAGTAIRGTTNNTAAAAGFIGETLETSWSDINFPGATNTAGDLGNISVTAGDWNICIAESDRPNTATARTYTQVGFATTSGSTWSGQVVGQTRVDGPAGLSGINATLSFCYHILVSTTTTYYAKMIGDYATGNPKTTGTMWIRRAR